MLFTLELYLEELSDHIEETSVECQTDAFLDKPATPLFIPAKSGKDAATQIEEGEVQINYVNLYKQVCVFVMFLSSRELKSSLRDSLRGLDVNKIAKHTAIEHLILERAT